MQALDGAVGRTMAKGATAILFSGGLDSGLLAALAKHHGHPHLYTVGIKGSPDLIAGRDTAVEMGLPWTGIVPTAAEVVAACRDLLMNCPIPNPVVLSFELPLHMVATRARETFLMTGQGADELFGGYGRYLNMSPQEQERGMREDLAKLLVEVEPLDLCIASHSAKTIDHPYLDPAVRRISSSIPVTEKIIDGTRKVPLRTIAAGLGLTSSASREKKAAQYGTGFMKVIKAQARKEGMDLSDYMRHLSSEPRT